MKTKTVVSVILVILIIILFISAIFLIIRSQTKDNDEDDLIPRCENSKDIEKYHNKTVELIGRYNYSNAGKCWVALIRLEDNTKVVYQYQPNSENITKYNNKTVRIIGTILRSYPETQLPLQFLILPHLSDILSIEITEQYPNN
ncbi:MAG: hypothetical protein ACMUIE_01245 [Thermoplasmatota archaeon]